MILHVLESLRQAGVERIILVIGNQGDLVQQVVGADVLFAVQPEPLGTGDAVRQALPLLDPAQDVLVTYGDTVLFRPETFRQLVDHHRRRAAAATLLSAYFDDPHGYGRVIRDAEGRFRAIVEEKDTSPEQQQIHEINTGTYCFTVRALQQTLPQLKPQNAQGEYYLTDVFSLLQVSGEPIEAIPVPDPTEAYGINDRIQLAQAEAVLRERIRRHWQEEGVTLVDPPTIRIDPDVEIGLDTIIEPNTWLARGTRVGEGCHIGPWAYLEGVTLEAGQAIAFTVCRGARGKAQPWPPLMPGRQGPSGSGDARGKGD